MKKSLWEISTQIGVRFRVFSLVVDEACDRTHEGTRKDITGQVALLCDKTVDSCALRDIGYPFAIVPIVPETRDHEVESVGGFAIKAHLPHMVVGDVLLDACGFLAGSLGIFESVFVGKEELDTTATRDGFL